MRTSTPYSRTESAPRASRAARFGALMFGVLAGALVAIGGGLLLVLLGLPTNGWLAAALMLLAVGAAGWIAALRVEESGGRYGLYAGLLLALLTLSAGLAGGERLEIAGIAAVGGLCSAAGTIGGWLSRRVDARRSRV